jgi:hypothetical protein
MDELITAFKALSQDYMANDQALLNLISEVIKTIDIQTQTIKSLQNRLDLMEDLHRLEEHDVN